VCVVQYMVGKGLTFDSGGVCVFCCVCVCVCLCVCVCVCVCVCHIMHTYTHRCIRCHRSREQSRGQEGHYPAAT
jgi:hypothetical protein